jgi:CRP-like cAMP-binding protein/tetratricopeptide (TPR) repeat protein
MPVNFGVPKDHLEASLTALASEPGVANDNRDHASQRSQGTSAPVLQRSGSLKTATHLKRSSSISGSAALRGRSGSTLGSPLKPSGSSGALGRSGSVIGRSGSVIGRSGSIGGFGSARKGSIGGMASSSRYNAARATDGMQTQPLLFALPDDHIPQQVRHPKLMEKSDPVSLAMVHHDHAIQLMHRENDYKGALQALDSALELAPRAVGLLMDRGLIYRKLGRWAEATADYSQARAIEASLENEAIEMRNRSLHGRSPSMRRGTGTFGRRGTGSTFFAERAKSVSKSISVLGRMSRTSVAILGASSEDAAAEAASAPAPANASAAEMDEDEREWEEETSFARAKKEKALQAARSRERERLAAAKKERAAARAAVTGEEEEESSDDEDEEWCNNDDEDEGEEQEDDTILMKDDFDIAKDFSSKRGGRRHAVRPVRRRESLAKFLNAMDNDDSDGDGSADEAEGLQGLSDGARNYASGKARTLGARVLEALRTPPNKRTLEQTNFLSRTLKCIPVLASMPDEDRLRICTYAKYKAVAEGDKVQNGEGDVVEGDQSDGSMRRTQQGGSFRQKNEKSKDGLNVLLFGECSVTKWTSSGAITSAVTLKAGDHYGGIDILHMAIQSASIRAIERCGMLCISAEEFKRMLRRNKLESSAEKATFIATCPLFQKLAWDRVLNMIRSFVSRDYVKGEAIVRQGEAPQGLFVLQEGRCSVTRIIEVLEDGERRPQSMHLEMLGARDTYGGDALLAEVTESQTSLIAESDVVSVFFIPRLDFTRAYLTSEAVSMLKVSAKLNRQNDATLAANHYQVRDWERTKKAYLREVLDDARARSGKITDIYFGGRQ